MSERPAGPPAARRVLPLMPKNGSMPPMSPSKGICADSRGQEHPPAADILSPSPVGNIGWRFLGSLVLVLNKLRNSVQGYRRPRHFHVSRVEQTAAYDLNVVNRWLDWLADYAGPATPAGRDVLELCPGADLGTGLILLARGAASYTAVDAFPLAHAAPPELYDRLRAAVIANLPAERQALLARYASLVKEGPDETVRYIVRSDFDLSPLAGRGFDLVFSQAALEHFDDVGRAVRQLARAVKTGAILIAEIDLQTHTGVLRDRDPLNIYRFGDRFYNLLRFRGSPNRLRPIHYRRLLQDAGWTNIQTIPLRRLEGPYLPGVLPNLAPAFRAADNQMDCLSVLLCATRDDRPAP